jgi:hypothetical protein
MEKTKIQQHFESALNKSVTLFETDCLVQAMLDILEELRDETIDELPSMKKSINDSFHMVMELIKDRT